MKDTIAAGSIMVAGGTHLPSSIVLQYETDSNGWAAIEDARTTFERKVQEAGWTFFLMAGEIKAIAFGYDKEKAIRTALNRLIADVKSLHCNSIEITQIIGTTFLKLPYVSVFAHARHLQKGLLFSSQQ
jgi:hypothetical protein